MSIYHTPWWLDIATDGQWREAKVLQDGAVIARMPYVDRTRLGLRISDSPSLIRTLGPTIAPLPGGPVAVARRRSRLVAELIDQLPRFDLFDQLFDPAITNVMDFLYRGYHISVVYSMSIDLAVGEDMLWATMTDKTRNVIRSARKTLHVVELTDADAFADFYDSTLAGRPNMHGRSRMRRLVAEMLARDAGMILAACAADGSVAAAAAIARDARASRYLLAARRADAMNGASSLVLWEAIRRARAQGGVFDLDGVTSPAVFLFLSGFGGKLVQRLRVRTMTARYRVARKTILRLVHS